MKFFAIAAAAAFALSGAAASASTITVSQFSTAAYGSQVLSSATTQDFETFTRGVLGGPLSTNVGSFTSIGGTGSGSTCSDNGGCDNLAIEDNGSNGQGNLLPVGGKQALNANDTFGIEWHVKLAGGALFDRVVYGLVDAGEFAKLTVSFLDSTGTLVSASYGPNAGNGNEKLVVIDFGTTVTSAFITMANTDANGNPKKNDGFTMDALAVMDVSAVPLPAGAWLMLAGLGGLAAMRRRQKA